jgi:hypothetical protein
MLRDIVIKSFIDAFEIDEGFVNADVINACTVLCKVLRQRTKNDILLDEPLFEDQTVDVFGELEVVSTALVETRLHIFTELQKFFIDNQTRFGYGKDGFDFF